MIEAAISQATAPCPKCPRDMDLTVITPHPIAQQLARHTYLCRACNQTKRTFCQSAHQRMGKLLAKMRAAVWRDLPASPTVAVASPGKRSTHTDTIYNKDGSFLAPCTVRDLSRSGGRVELFKGS